MPRSSGGGWRQIGLQGSVKSVSRGEASLLASGLAFTENLQPPHYQNIPYVRLRAYAIARRGRAATVLGIRARRSSTANPPQCTTRVPPWINLGIQCVYRNSCIQAQARSPNAGLHDGESELFTQHQQLRDDVPSGPVPVQCAIGEDA